MAEAHAFDPMSVVAPTSTDSSTLVLWIIAVLVIVAGFAFKYILAQVKENRDECKKRDEENKKRIDEKESENRSLYQSVIMDQKATQVQTNSALTRMADAIDGLTTVIGSQSQLIQTQMADEETRQHHRKRAS